MSNIEYITADALAPVGPDPKFIIHVCNDEGRWGSGFVVALSKRWTEPEKNYRAATAWRLGDVQFVKVTDSITVVNMIAQEGIREDLLGNPPIRYEALRSCLQKVAGAASLCKATVHGPHFGAGLAGGKWEVIEQIIKDEVCSMDVPITIYALTSNGHREMSVGDHVEFCTEAQTPSGPCTGSITFINSDQVNMDLNGTIEPFTRSNLQILGGCSNSDGETWWRLK
jgi:O-acetyl-ADP-ribose deacetylase (regulator of RNase III)